MNNKLWKKLSLLFLGSCKSRSIVPKTAPRKSSGISNIISEALIAGIAVSLGIVLLFLSSSWSLLTATSSVNQTNKEIAQQWSILVIEHAWIPTSGSSAYIWVSNPGRYDLVILYCAVYPSGSQPPTGEFRKIAEVRASMGDVVMLTCPINGNAENYIAEVRALPTILYDPSKPLNNIQYSILVRTNVSP